VIRRRFTLMCCDSMSRWCCKKVSSTVEFCAVRTANGFQLLILFRPSFVCSDWCFQHALLDERTVVAVAMGPQAGRTATSAAALSSHISDVSIDHGLCLLNELKQPHAAGLVDVKGAKESGTSFQPQPASVIDQLQDDRFVSLPLEFIALDLPRVLHALVRATPVSKPQ